MSLWKCVGTRLNGRCGIGVRAVPNMRSVDYSLSQASHVMKWNKEDRILYGVDRILSYGHSKVTWNNKPRIMHFRQFSTETKGDHSSSSESKPSNDDDDKDSRSVFGGSLQKYLNQFFLK